jgi:transketolase
LAKGEDQVVSSPKFQFEIGKAIHMRTGPDALIITTGITLKPALEAADELAKQGIQAGVLHVHTIKPIDKVAILKHASQVPVIVTIEEHTLVGGLGSAVAEIITEANFNPAKHFKRLGIPDVFAEHYGSQESLMLEFGISSKELVRVIKDLSKQTDKKSRTKKKKTK